MPEQQSQLFARKSLKVLLDEMAGDHRLKRVLGPVTLTALGIGAVIGAGIFVATGHFSPAAVSFVEQVSRRVALIDGRRLAELMIRHNVGVRAYRSYQVKRVDPAYFKRPAEQA